MITKNNIESRKYSNPTYYLKKNYRLSVNDNILPTYKLKYVSIKIK